MFRPILFCLVLFLAVLPSTSGASDPVSVKISNFGLEGTYNGNSGPTWVQVALRNTSGQPLSFKLRVAERNLLADASPMSETCILFLRLAVGEERLVSVPLSIPSTSNEQSAVVYVEALDARGFPIGRTARRMERKTEGQLIALLCATPELCNAIRRSVLLAGTPEEQSRKSQNLRLIQVSEPPPVGWAYAGADTVVVAISGARLASEQRDALELYMLRGGNLLVVEDQLADAAGSPRFLETYRSRVPEGKVFPAGAGKFLRVPSVSSKDFSDYFRPLGFSGSTSNDALALLARFRRDESRGGFAGDLHWLMKRMGTSFRFPSFLRLLLWMLGYLVLVGIVNFVVLRRIGRPEWGWITIPTISVLFSVVLYVVSVRTHPSNFGLDEMDVYQMDDFSSLATSAAYVRVSAPVRSSVRLVLPGDVTHARNQGTLALEGQGVNFQLSTESVNEFQLGETWETQMSLRRWSFRDLEFESLHRFPGTVYRDSAGRLHNETGVSYRQAILVDRLNVFVLDKLPAGAVVDLAHVPRSPYESETGRARARGPGYPNPPFPYRALPEWQPFGPSQQHFDQEFEALANQPFSLIELIRGWPPNGDKVFTQTRAIFFGLSNEPMLGASLRDRSPDRRGACLTIVTFGEWP